MTPTTGPTRRWSADLEVARRLLAAGATADELYGRWFQAAGDPQGVAYPTASAYVAGTADPARRVGGWTVDIADAGAPGALLVHGPLDPASPPDQRVVLPPSYQPGPGAGLVPSPGDAVLVDPLVTNEGEGFWHIWSDAWRRRGAPPRLRRVYLSALRGSEIRLAGALAAHGPADEVWCAKCACGYHGGERRDSVVVYLPADDERPAWVGLPAWMLRLVRATADLRREEPPPLTGWVGRGAGAAADPGGDSSFGQAVCASLAEVARAAPAALLSADAWDRAVVARLGALLGGARPPQPEPVER